MAQMMSAHADEPHLQGIRVRKSTSTMPVAVEIKGTLCLNACDTQRQQQSYSKNRMDLFHIVLE